jgi:regulator of protease activity HflC (stomatin/prohibitin superfamily)
VQREVIVSAIRGCQVRTSRRFGYIVAGPAEFAIHRRRGRTRKVGLGISLFCLPLIDRCYLIPSTAQSISFAADQITAENQGVEVAGFAVWKVADPEKAAASFDFLSSAAALTSIGENLRNVVESAIRHQVANMTIEDALRKRGSIILQLKNELAYIARQWGLVIETVEIRNVKVLSNQLFAQMQAPFRDKMRLNSETSALLTEKQLAEHRLAQKEEIAQREREFERRDLERKSEAARIKIAADGELQAFRLDQQRELVAREESLHAAQAVLEADRHRHKAALAVIEDETRRRQIETSNMESRDLVMARQMVAALGALKVHEVNLGDASLSSLVRGLHRMFEGSKIKSDP